MNSKISVIVPVYNVEDYLQRCVQSILSQIHKELEIILVDDGSTDSSALICDKLACEDSRIKVIHKVNGGLSSARNEGINIATGEYIAFVDSDDYIDPHMYNRMLDSITNNNADLCICGTKWINEDGSLFTGTIQSVVKDEVLEGNCKFDKLCQEGSFYYVMAVCKLYKKHLFDGVRFPVGRIHEDEFVVHRLFSQCKRITCLQEELYYYVQRKNSIMHGSYSIKHLDAVYAYLDRYLFFKKHHYYTTWPLYQAYGTLMLCMKKNDVYNERHIIWRAIVDVCKELKCNPRAVKLLLWFLYKVSRGVCAYFKYKIYLAKHYYSQKTRFVLLGTPVHGNLGDQAIVYSEKQFIKEHYRNSIILEVPNDLLIRFPKLCMRYIRGNDTIIIDGGGNLGTLWQEEDDKISNIIQMFRNNRIVIFPQTCFYDGKKKDKRIINNRKTYRDAKCLSVMLRDKASFDYFTDCFRDIKAYYVPDIALRIRLKSRNNRRHGVILCFREDLERMLNKESEEYIKMYLSENKIPFKNLSTVVPYSITQKNREQELMSIWEEFANAELVITDRLHAMIFSAITGTPCIAADNKSGKVGGTYEWISELDYIRFTPELCNIPNMINEMKMKNCLYTFEYPDWLIERILS